MSITDELRAWAKEHLNRNSIFAIADRIDAEHESACAEAYGNGVMSVPIALDESAWVKLPKDADGEPIHVGDKLIDEDDKLQKPAIVKCILYNDEGCVVSDIDPRGCWYDPSLLRHHAPTVEDVLREFAEKMNENLGMYTGEAIDADEWRSADAKTIAEYAKRLTLADGEDA